MRAITANDREHRMNRSTSRFIGMLAVLAISLLPSFLAEAASAKGQIPKATPLSKSYTWYDGDKKRTIYLNPNLLAEFHVTDEAQSKVLQTVPAKAVSRKGAVRIWRVDDETPALLLGILSVTRNPAGSTGLPTEDELREALRGSARRFEELLQNHTDSKPTPA